MHYTISGLPELNEIIGALNESKVTTDFPEIEKQKDKQVVL
jgi:hypothetical protein